MICIDFLEQFVNNPQNNASTYGKPSLVYGLFQGDDEKCKVLGKLKKLKIHFFDDDTPVDVRSERAKICTLCDRQASRRALLSSSH